MRPPLFDLDLEVCCPRCGEPDGACTGLGGAVWCPNCDEPFDHVRLLATWTGESTWALDSDDGADTVKVRVVAADLLSRGHRCPDCDVVDNTTELVRLPHHDAEIDVFTACDECGALLIECGEER